MRRSIWSLVLCAGVCAAALIGTRAVEADRPSVDERQPAAPVCTSDATDEAVALMCGKCGDHYCSASCGETATSCPRDCGATTAATELMCGKCGDHYCSASCGETAASCPKDCGTPS